MASIGGFFSTIGRGLGKGFGAIGRGLRRASPTMARIASVLGSDESLREMQRREKLATEQERYDAEQERQALRDELNRRLAESTLESQGLSRKVTQRQLDQPAMTPQQKMEMEIEQNRREKEDEARARGYTEEEKLVPDLVPTPTPLGPITMPKIQRRFIPPPREDTSVSAYEDFRRKYPRTPEGQAQAASDWQDKLRPPKMPQIPGAGVPLYNDPSNPNKVTGYWFPKSEGGQTVIPAPGGGVRTKPIAPGDVESLSGMDTLTEQLGKLRTMVELRPDVVGPVGGRMEWLQSVTTGGDREAASIIQTSTDIQNQLVYLLSGKQINEKEYARLKEALPDYRLPLDTFKVRLDNFETRLKEVIARRKLGLAVAPPVPSTTPKVGDRKTFPNGSVGEWDGDGWVLVSKP